MTKISQKLFSLTFLTVFAFVALFANGSAAFPAAEKTNKNQICDETGKYPVCVNGGDIASFFPKSDAPAKTVVKKYDVIVVGGGLAGLMASVYLTDREKSVLLIEKEPTLGGLAQGNGSGVRYDRGAAYFTDAYEEEAMLLKHIHLDDYEKFEIPEPIDSYFWSESSKKEDFKLYPGIWEHETLKDLPGSFDLFRIVLLAADYFGEIPNQPFEDFEKYKGNMNLDKISGAEWINAMPTIAPDYLPRLKSEGEKLAKQLASARGAVKPSKTRIDNLTEKAEKTAKYIRELRAAIKRYDLERPTGRLKGKAGMDDVIGLMDLYCRSALGALTQQVSAMVFANFYISEVVPRFTTPIGTGFASTQMENMLHSRPTLANITVNSAVKKITQGPKDVTVTYQNGDNNYEVKASYVIFSAQLGSAPKIIEGLAEKSPAQSKLMSELGYSHYSVHAVTVEGHPYRATYDTWTRAPDYSNQDFTDLILGRWMDPIMLGYEGYRDFKADPPDNVGVLSIYHPIATSDLKDYKDGEAMDVARRSVARMEELYSHLPEEIWKGPLQIKRVETNRWPFSVHIAAPYQFIEKAKELRKPFGRVFFAHSNLGTPAFEEALFRGHCAANHVAEAMDKTFKYESWSRCPPLSEIRNPKLNSNVRKEFEEKLKVASQGSRK